MSSPPMSAIITISTKPARCFAIELRHQHNGAGGGASAAGLLLEINDRGYSLGSRDKNPLSAGLF
jgi:hypothetical protein